MSLSLSRIPYLYYIIDGLFFLFITYYLYVTLVLHSVCLFKIFQRTFFRFGSESVYKGKRFIFNHQIFSNIFFEKIFEDKKPKEHFSLLVY